jgi:hypothetical protein
MAKITLTDDEQTELDKVRHKAYLDELKKIEIKKAREEAKREPVTLTGVAKRIWKKI